VAGKILGAADTITKDEVLRDGLKSTVTYYEVSLQARPFDCCAQPCYSSMANLSTEDATLRAPRRANQWIVDLADFYGAYCAEDLHAKLTHMKQRN
jgi:hypothetical protein